MTTLEMQSDAYISDDETYRYWLTRVWNDALPMLAWCGLNPSTADHRKNDPTTNKEIKFSMRWGFGGLLKVNIAAFRATDPALLSSYVDPVGPENDDLIWSLTEGLSIIAAWGASMPKSMEPRAHVIGQRMRAERNCSVLGLTKGGFPRHPLYMRDDTEPVRWAA